MKFSSKDIEIKVLEDGNVSLLKDFWYIDKNNTEYKANKGFIFDGASIPKSFWRLITHPLNHNIIRSACIHDLLYKTGDYSKEHSDNIFKEMMGQEDRLSKWKQYLVYQAVSKLGDTAWETNREEDK